ncbi:hypothetical protein CRM22_004982 [Opisthorchis felineus]|uniref:PUM-HD domain-containing protein n=2 Tax=Opisthorchis felineus TaxID=147828 RepID=A0A4S2LTC7_OPIFE|nr:hypothetical protein CRM22_004982 [Opisthorchis felineus]
MARGSFIGKFQDSSMTTMSKRRGLNSGKGLQKDDNGKVKNTTRLSGSAVQKQGIVKILDRPRDSKKVVTEKKSIKEKRIPKGSKRKGGEKKVYTKRDLRLMRLRSKKHADVVMKILPLWEVLRRNDTPKEKRFELINDILSKTRDKIADLCLPHDSARIMESVIQYGTEAQRWKLFAEIKSHLRLLSKSKYAKHIVIKLLKYGDREHQLEVLKVFRGHMTKLIGNRTSVEVVDLLYNDYANATQRGGIMQELYGNVHALKLVENQIHTLDGALALNPDKKRAILSHVNELLVSMVSKGLTKYTVVQHLLLEYLQTVASDGKESSVQCAVSEDADNFSPDEKLLSLIELLVEGQVVPMLHTREGVRAALHALWAAPPRLRKPLVRGLKTCVSSIARNEHGHLFLIGLLDMVDDMVLLKKLVIKEIIEDLKLFCVHPEARKVLLYMLSPRDPHHFSPQLQHSLFIAGDSNPHTKKPLGIRALELRHPDLKLLPRLLQLISTNLLELFVGSSSSEGLLAYEDRGRLVLLAEVLIRSASHHLSYKNVVASYQRSTASAPNTEVADSCGLSDQDVDQLRQLRQTALKQIVDLLLVPGFVPVGTHKEATDAKSNIGRDDERIKRHKRAVKLVEKQLGQVTKPDFASFEDGERMEDDESFEPTPTACAMPFLERPEGQLLMRRLLKDGQLHKDFIFGRMILEHVPPSNLCAWTRCNRSCFVLVNMYEMGDPKMCKLLRSALKPCIPELSVSPLPGAKVLYKHLSCSD